jgi:hypothetical protein
MMKWYGRNGQAAPRRPDLVAESRDAVRSANSQKVVAWKLLGYSNCHTLYRHLSVLFRTYLRLVREFLALRVKAAKTE